MATSLITYALGTRYIADPAIVLLIVFILTVILFIITFSITRTLEGLAEANKLKSEFVSIVSHQLRSPISNLKWALEALSSDKLCQLGEKEVEYVDILEDNTKRMGELVSALLMVSRIEQGRLPLRNQKFSLENITQESIKQFTPVAVSSNVEIKLEISKKPLPDVFGDPSQIRLVVDNFIDNAIRYSKEKNKIAVVIDKRGRDVLFSVKDQGVGIPKKDQKNIFQKFFRSSNALRYETHGSGLGLYIAKSIINMSKGKIGFKSEENKGSTFWFTIPTK